MANHVRRLGVEIEVGQIWGRDLAASLREAGIPAMWREYTHDYVDEWKVVSDGSVRDGCEVVSPPLTRKQAFEQLKVVTRVIRESEGRIDTRCGFHVHHQASDLVDLDLYRLATFCHFFEKVIDSLVAPSRRDNRYCAGWSRPRINVWHSPIRRRTDWSEFLLWLRYNEIGRVIPRDQPDLREFVDFDDLDRYRKVNFRSLGSYGTIEFRQHQGTLNARKMAMWVDLTQRIVDRSKHPLNYRIRHFVPMPTLDDLLEELGIWQGMPQYNYWHSRASELSRR